MFLWGGIILFERERKGGGSYLASKNIPTRTQTLWRKQLSPTQTFPRKVAAVLCKHIQFGGVLWEKP